jgi:TraM recognition site of TraD and TraG
MSWHTKAFDYDGWTSRLKTGDAKLKKHFFLGTSTWTGEPILLADEILGEHIWVTGGSGSGKSALILAPLVSQLIGRGDHSVVFIDQKGDPPSFWNCFDAAFDAEMTFKYFTVVPGEESFIYNPLRQEVHGRITTMQRSELFAQSAGFDHGEVYGADFFQAKNEMTLCNYLTHYSDPPLEEYVSLFRLFDDKHSYTSIGHLDDWTDASHMRALLMRIASMSPLNATPKNLPKPSAHASAMDMFEPLRIPSVYYFKLPASMGRNACRFIARSVLQNLFAAAGLRSPSETVPVFLVCDEFQELVSNSVDVLLEQFRSRGVSCCLAHQSISQLERNGANLLPVVQACTSTHLVVEATDFDSVEYVQKRSGQAYYALASWSQAAPIGETPGWMAPGFFSPWKATASNADSTPLVNVREELGYRMDENFIRKASADNTMAFVAVKKNSGFSNFDGFMIPLRAYFHIDKTLFTNRSKEPWPKWDRPETMIVALTSPFQTKPVRAKPTSSESIQIVPPPQAADFALRERLRTRGREPRQGPGSK